MINKAFHLAVLGFYTVLALFIGLGALLFNAGAFTALSVFASIFLLCGAGQAFFIIMQLVRFGANAALDLEDANLHLRDENEKMRRTLDRFADILDTTLEQQQELEGKLSEHEKDLRRLKSDVKSPETPLSSSAPVTPAPTKPKKAEPIAAEETPVFGKRNKNEAPAIKQAEETPADLPVFLSDDEEFSFADQKADLPEDLREKTVIQVTSPQAEEDDDEFAENFAAPLPPKPETPYMPPLTRDLPNRSVSARVEAREEKIISQKEYARAAAQELDEEEFEDFSGAEADMLENSRLIHARLNDDEEEFLDISDILQRSASPDEFVKQAEKPIKKAAKPAPVAREILPEEEDFSVTPPVAVAPRSAKKVPPAAPKPSASPAPTEISSEQIPPLKELVKDDPSAFIKNRSGGTALPETDIPSLEKLQKSVTSAEAAPANKAEENKNTLLESLLTNKAEPAPAPELNYDAKIKRALRYSMEHNTADLFLRPVLDFMTKEVRFFDGHTRIRDEDNQYYGPNEYMKIAAEGGMAAALDRLLLTRSVQIIRSLLVAKKNISLFANVLLQSVTDDYFFDEFIDMIREKGDISKNLVPVFRQEQLDYLTSAGVKKLIAMKEAGFHFCLDCADTGANIALEHLTGVGFRYLKITPEMMRDGVMIDGVPAIGDEIRKICNLRQCELSVSGVDRAGQAEAIGQIGCDLMSGDMYGEAERVYKSQLGL